MFCGRDVQMVVYLPGTIYLKIQNIHSTQTQFSLTLLIMLAYFDILQLEDNMCAA